MSSAREAILERIRTALQQARGEREPPISLDYLRQSEAEQTEVIIRFVERVEDYKARVIPTPEADLPARLSAVCAERGWQRLAAPADVPATWLKASLEVVRDEPPLSYETLDTLDAVITGCRVAIAQTGTIVLDGGAYQGRRALSLVPDVHLCVVRADQVVDLVPEAISALQASATRPLTFISGPSATSDIELSRVEGVHGPRTLIVFLLQPVNRPARPWASQAGG